MSELKTLKRKIAENRIPIATINGGMHRLDLTTDEYQIVSLAILALKD